MSDRGEGQQGSAASAPQLLADDTGPDGDQSPAATPVTLRPHDPATGEEIEKRRVVRLHRNGAIAHVGAGRSSTWKLISPA